MSAIYYWPYVLRSRNRLNAASYRREFEGALIRVGDGVGCIHPWPELGDASLDRQLAKLAAGESTRLVASALDCARLDGEARGEGRSLFAVAGEAMPQPSNHRLVQQGDDPSEWRERGFETAKFKIGPELDEVCTRVEPWVSQGFRIRLDGNETAEFRSFLDWWKSLPGELREAIEFVEDPVPWGRFSWCRLRRGGVPLAADRDLESRYRGASVAVYKPATDGGNGFDTRLVGWAVRRKRRLVVTSYMDHAIGQVWAAYAAGCLEAVCPEVVADCGLLTHDCFEPDPFFETIAVEGPRLVPPDGTGLGFDDLLEKLPWKRLS